LGQASNDFSLKFLKAASLYKLTLLRPGDELAPPMISLKSLGGGGTGLLSFFGLRL
jgi:hypothetical protein